MGVRRQEVRCAAAKTQSRARQTKQSTKNSKVALTASGARRSALAAPTVSADSDVSMSIDAGPSAPCTELSSPPERPLVNGDMSSDPQVVVVPQTTQIDPFGQELQRTTKSSAAAGRHAQQALPVAKIVRAPRKARTSKPPPSAMVSESLGSIAGRTKSQNVFPLNTGSPAITPRW